MNANVPKPSDNSTALSLVDVGQPREPAKLRILDDEGPLTIKARRPVADAKPRGDHWPYHVVRGEEQDGRLCAHKLIDGRDSSMIACFAEEEQGDAWRMRDRLNGDLRRATNAAPSDRTPSHYTTFCDRRGRVLSTDRPVMEKEGATGRDAPPPKPLMIGQVWKDNKGRSAEITALGDDWVYYLAYLPAVIGSAEENDSHEDVFRSDFPVLARDTPPPPLPPQNNPSFDESPLPMTDLDLAVASIDHAIRGGDAVCECDERDGEPCKGGIMISGEPYIPPGPWPTDSPWSADNLDRVEADLIATARQPERRSHLNTVDARDARVRMTDRDRADLEAAMEAAWEAFADEIDDLDDDFDDEDRDTLAGVYASLDRDRNRKLLGVVTVAALAGLVVGAVIGILIASGGGL